MNLLLTFCLLSQIESGIPSPSTSDRLQPPAYFDMAHIPAYSAGYSHCEQDVKNPKYYACKPQFLPMMAVRFPRVEFEGHYLDWSARDQLYRFHYSLPSGSADPYAGKPAKWTERQDFDSKQVERHLILPTTTPATTPTSRK